MNEEQSKDKKRAMVYYRERNRFAQLNNDTNQHVGFLKRLVEINPDTELVGVAVDELMSENPGPELKRLLEESQKGVFDLLVVESIENFAGFMCDNLELVKKFAESGVDVYYYIEDLSSTSPDFPMELTILTTLAQKELRMESRKRKISRVAYR